MSQNPKMRVLVQQGYYDLATPYGATEYFINQMEIPGERRGDIILELYEAGHMMYVHPASRAKFREDLAAFITE
jgi:carboxypeptidase C (cathepsin A)